MAAKSVAIFAKLFLPKFKFSILLHSLKSTQQLLSPPYMETPSLIQNNAHIINCMRGSLHQIEFHVRRYNCLWENWVWEASMAGDIILLKPYFFKVFKQIGQTEMIVACIGFYWLLLKKFIAVIYIKTILLYIDFRWNSVLAIIFDKAHPLMTCPYDGPLL